VKGFMLRPALAELLGVQTGTLAAWDRKGKGVGGRGRIFIGETSVAYRIEDVERFIEERYGLPSDAFVGQDVRAVRLAERLARSGATKPPDAPEADAHEHDDAPVPVTTPSEEEAE
jgi:hypothetical protein